MHEIETKILEIKVEEVKKKLEALGAKQTQNVLLKVDWFGQIENKNWFLRIRSYSSGKVEVTLKSDPKVVGTVRKVNEINLIVDDHEKMKLLFESIGLPCYAHQEKKRVSWKLDGVAFDLDTYPGMPAYLEIEGESEEAIQTMIKKLDLSSYETYNHGERTLIEGKYKLNWCDMRF